MIKLTLNTFLLHGTTAPSGPRPPHYRGFTITLRHTTLGRIPLDEWPDRCRNLYLTTHSIHKRHVFVSPAGFEPATPSSECLQTKALDRAAAGISWHWVHTSSKFQYAWTRLWKLVMRLTVCPRMFAAHSNVSVVHVLNFKSEHFSRVSC